MATSARPVEALVRVCDAAAHVGDGVAHAAGRVVEGAGHVAHLVAAAQVEPGREVLAAQRPQRVDAPLQRPGDRQLHHAGQQQGGDQCGDRAWRGSPCGRWWPTTRRPRRSAPPGPAPRSTIASETLVRSRYTPSWPFSSLSHSSTLRAASGAPLVSIATCWSAVAKYPCHLVMSSANCAFSAAVMYWVCTPASAFFAAVTSASSPERFGASSFAAGMRAEVEGVHPDAHLPRADVGREVLRLVHLLDQRAQVVGLHGRAVLGAEAHQSDGGGRGREEEDQQEGGEQAWSGAQAAEQAHEGRDSRAGSRTAGVRERAGMS